MTALLASASAEDHAKYLAGNALVCADNIDVLRALPDSSVDLIYLDPPFQSDTHYVAIFGDKGQVDQQLKDIWKWTTETERTFQRVPLGSKLLDTLKGIQLQAGPTSPMAAYSVFMGRRLLEMRRVLKPTGSIYLHCDYHASHYLRLLMDAVFGEDAFRNEIIWHYPDNFQGNVKRFASNSNTILFYAGDHFTFHHVRVPLAKPKKRGGRVWSKEEGRVVAEKVPTASPYIAPILRRKPTMYGSSASPPSRIAVPRSASATRPRNLLLS